MHNFIHNSRQYSIEEPDYCPYCHNFITPNYHHQFASSEPPRSNILKFHTIWSCSNSNCNRIIIAIYYGSVDNSVRPMFERFLSGFPKVDKWPPVITDLKNGNPNDPSIPEETKFMKTYLQSLQAEQEGLNEIAGMGYRKAIEYLVKDWAIKEKSDDKEKIIKLPLGQVVSTYFEGNLKSIIEKAVWLGNDEVHYTKLFDEFDITALKELIQLISSTLDSELRISQWNTLDRRKH